MKKNKYISILVFQFLLCTICAAQNEKLTFNRVPPPTGFHPSSKACVQDLQGYMWIGTYQAPLRRYDGYNYVTYSNDPQNSNSLAGNWVEALCASRDGFIWIGTWGNGLDRLDPATGNFKHFRYKKDRDSLSNDTVRTILEDRDGLLWIGTPNGLNRYDPKTGKFQRYFYKRDDPYSLSCNQVVKIYEDTQGTIWVGTGSVWKGEGGETDEGGLNRFDKKTGKFIRYLHNPANPHSLINNKVKAIFEDTRGVFWVGTAGDGLHIMNRAKDSFERLRYDPTHPEKLSRPAQKKIRPHADDHITFIIEDSAGAIWIGTFGNGLNRYDPKTNKVTHYPLFKDPVSGIQLEVAWWACTSRDGMLWLGYWRGVYRIDPLRKTIPFFATGVPVDEMLEDRFGVLWYGTDQGVVRKDRGTGTEHRFVNDPNNPHTISTNRINSIYEDRQGRLWVGTQKGLDLFDRNTGTFIRHTFNKALDSIINAHGISTMYEDRQGSFWIGYQFGLIHINRQANTIRYYGHDPNDTNTLAKPEVDLIYEDRSGNIWVATFGGTLHRFSPQTEKFQRFLNGINIHSVRQDSEGVLWVGTSFGLYRSNASLNSFARYTGPNGEFSGNIIVNCVLEDNQKNLWFSASAGICRLNPQRNEVKIFSRGNDPIFYNRTGIYKGTNGELFFGGSSGYFIFFPDQLTENTKPPSIVINEFRLSDRPVVPGKESVLRQPLSQSKEIRLRHNQNVFSFDFAGIHYSNPKENQHLFKLEGLDNNWRKAGEEKTAYYYNVPPARYIFHVMAANSDGVWTQKSIVVIISPPWWQTWWAYCIYGLLLIAAVFTIYRIQKKRVIKAEREKTRVRELAQAKEIEKAYQELQTTQDQLIQSEKMASLGELTSGIAHEIKNPLNFINNFSELNVELITEIEQEQIPNLNGKMNDELASIINTLRKNSEKINHHGKRVDEIVKSMLQHSRLGNLVKEPVNINSLCEESLRLAYHGFKAKEKTFNAAFETHFDPDLPMIMAIPQDIGRVLLNLINNAFYTVNERKKKSQADTPEMESSYKPMVTITTKKCDNKLLITVSDNGMGIPEKIINKVFQPFFTTKPTGEGTGLGLSMSYDIITKSHGGELHVKSKEGEGTDFELLLPVQ
ncbi:MAG: two-component regulator propeller domain-containing protein [Chitinophagaceae bacterium]|nr:two-component regulator propeller domain-containing protein [Chitinophagaceae bacterium]